MRELGVDRLRHRGPIHRERHRASHRDVVERWHREVEGGEREEDEPVVVWISGRSAGPPGIAAGAVAEGRRRTRDPARRSPPTGRAPPFRRRQARCGRGERVRSGSSVGRHEGLRTSVIDSERQSRKPLLLGTDPPRREPARGLALPRRLGGIHVFRALEHVRARRHHHAAVAAAAAEPAPGRRSRSRRRAGRSGAPGAGGIGALIGSASR